MANLCKIERKLDKQFQLMPCHLRSIINLFYVIICFYPICLFVFEIYPTRLLMTEMLSDYEGFYQPV